MRVYQAIIWFSVLGIIGEGVILSGFDFVPLNAQGPGIVLGDTTTRVLEQVTKNQYPATYTIAPLERENVEDILANDTARIGAEEGSDLISAEEAASTGDGSVDRMLEALNTQSPADKQAALFSSDPTPINTDGPQINNLILKNKRLYRKRLIKELDGIRKDLEETHEVLESGLDE